MDGVELDFRTTGEIEVTLLWIRADDSVLVRVVDWTTNEIFGVRPPREQALDAFRHPYAYRRVDRGLLVA